MVLNILPANPFASLDQEGVGELIRIASAAARITKPDIKLGACGEHAGDPPSAAFLVRTGIDSVSCSPFRVPMARLAVAQALLECGRVHINDVEFDFDATVADGHPTTDDTSSAGHQVSETLGGGAALEVDEALVLHVLRVRGFVTGDGFTESLGVHPAALLEDLIESGMVRYIEARDMYALLPPGKERHETLLDSYATGDVRGGLGAHYESFLRLNDQFKQLCTDWQMKGDTPNDHADHEYDDQCVDRLTTFAAEADPVIAGFASALPRMDRYRSRLARAADCVMQGETNRFTGVMCESFHDIWMELHEDLIVLQRIDRTAEGSF